jgi:hypothetical protein
MAAPSLRDTQRWLAGVILDPAQLDAGGGDPTATIVADAATARIRLGAYTGGYPARLEEALAEGFPALRHVLGADTFHALVHRYVPHVPAGIYNLHDVGANLAAFLARDEIAREVPLCVDLARLELAVHRAFHATLAPPFDPTALAGWSVEDWDGAVVRMQPGVALVDSPWPIHDVWEARTRPRETIDIVVEGRPQRVLVYRDGWRVAAEVLGFAEAGVLEQVLAGETLGIVMTRLAAHDVDGNAVTSWLAGWVSRGLVAACSLRE